MQNKMVLALALAAGAFLFTAQARADGDAAKGKKIFNKCALCHSPEKGVNKVGPSLFGVYGRKSASIPDFNYSDGLKKLNVTWDDQNLDHWLQGPKKWVPDTKMIFPGLPKESERQDVIAYLKTLK